MHKFCGECKTAPPGALAMTVGRQGDPLSWQPEGSRPPTFFPDFIHVFVRHPIVAHRPGERPGAGRSHRFAHPHASAAGAPDRVDRGRVRHRHATDRHRQEPDRRRRQDPGRSGRGDRAGRHAGQDPGGFGHHRAPGQRHPEPHLAAHDPLDHDAGGVHHRHPDVLRSGPGGDAAADLQRGPQAGRPGALQGLGLRLRGRAGDRGAGGHARHGAAASRPADGDRQPQDHGRPDHDLWLSRGAARHDPGWPAVWRLHRAAHEHAPRRGLA